MDEIRSFFLQNLWYVQGIEKYGFIEGAGVAVPLSQPQTTFRGMTYFTDGYRAVLWVSGKPMAFSDVDWLDWEMLPER